jgi:hypothetical protein
MRSQSTRHDGTLASHLVSDEILSACKRSPSDIPQRRMTYCTTFITIYQMSRSEPEPRGFFWRSWPWQSGNPLKAHMTICIWRTARRGGERILKERMLEHAMRRLPSPNPVRSLLSPPGKDGLEDGPEEITDCSAVGIAAARRSVTGPGRPALTATLSAALMGYHAVIPLSSMLTSTGTNGA